MKQPLVSIITGYYNRAQYVENSINSLISQTYSNIEIIIFDDNSTDDTFAEILKIAQTDSRIKCFKNNMNIGFTKSLIHAVKTSEGEYIAIHGSGDFSEKNRIELQVKAMNLSQDIAIVGCNSRRITTSGEIIEEIYASKKSGSHPFLHAELLYRKSAILDVGNYRDFFVVGQGTDLWERILSKYTFKIVDEFLYSQVLIDGTLSKNKNKLLERELLARYRLILCDERKENKIDSLERYGNLFYLHQPTSISFEFGYFKTFLRSRLVDDDLRNRLINRIFKQLLSIVFLPLYLLSLFIPRKILRRIIKKTHF